MRGWAHRLRALLDPRYEEELFARFERRRLEEYRVWGPRERVHLSSTALMNDALFNTSSGHVRVADHVMCGHGVSLLTGTHDIALFGEDRQRSWPLEGRDIVLEAGVWIGSNATLLGPCRIGRHAVVAAGSVVTGDVAPFTIVAGVPARVVRTIPGTPS